MIPAQTLPLLLLVGVTTWALITPIQGEDKELRQNFGKSGNKQIKKVHRELPVAILTV